MKNISHIFTLLALFIFCFDASAQDNANAPTEAGRIGLSVFVPQQVDKITSGTANMLINKLNQVVTQRGFAGDTYFNRFIVTVNIVPLTKDILPTAPPMIAQTLEITFYIGDRESGTLFASKSVTVKGVGTNETKSYIDAIKNIRPTDPAFDMFLDEGKSKIVNYYNTKCDAMLTQAQMLTSQNSLEEAIALLSGVPDTCMDCYNKCIDAIAPIYRLYIDRDCLMKLSAATHIWNANQTIEAANEAGKLLSTIEPSAKCFKDVKVLVNRISKRVKEINNNEWGYVLRQQDLAGERIRAYRDISIAWAQRPQPEIRIQKTENYIKNWIDVH